MMLDTLVRYLGRSSATVLLFHKVPKHMEALAPSDADLAQFERVLDFVLDRFRIVPLTDLVKGLQGGKLPPNSASLTFDDGYADWVSGVVPLLLQRGVHASFYITTGQFHGIPMWNERVNHAVSCWQPDTLHLPGFDTPAMPVRSLLEKRQAASWLQLHLKYQPMNRRMQMLDALEVACTGLAAKLPLLTAESLRDIHSKGFGVGAHSINHPILSHTTEAEAWEEIAGSKEELEHLVGGGVDSFAYPNGKPGVDFLAEHISMVKRAGYRYALTTQHGVVRNDSSLFQMPRFTPWGKDPLRMVSQVLRNQIGSQQRLQEQ